MGVWSSWRGSISQEWTCSCSRATSRRCASGSTRPSSVSVTSSTAPSSYGRCSRSGRGRASSTWRANPRGRGRKSQFCRAHHGFAKRGDRATSQKTSPPVSPPPGTTQTLGRGTRMTYVLCGHCGDILKSVLVSKDGDETGGKRVYISLHDLQRFIQRAKEEQ